MEKPTGQISKYPPLFSLSKIEKGKTFVHGNKTGEMLDTNIRNKFGVLLLFKDNFIEVKNDPIYNLKHYRNWKSITYL